MVTTLTSTVNGDDAPSTVDGGIALHGNLFNAPHNLFTASSSSRQQWFVAEEEQPFPTMVTNGDAGEDHWVHQSIQVFDHPIGRRTSNEITQRTT
ncbi:hypothetical protein JHK84_044039 [Glycine max]|nr:hypothetical protein JHK84_044039 [Glycine max]